MNQKKLSFKRVLACLMVVIMTLSSVPMSGFVGLELPKWSQLFATRASATSEGYYTYNVSNGEVTITDCDTSISGDVVIPDTLGGYPVTSIGDSAFSSCNGLTSVTIPDSVTSIGNSAFVSCIGLTSVTIPDSVTSIGDSAFYNCDNLTGVIIPDSVTRISDRTFCNCDSLNSVTIGRAVTNIGSYAFNGCTGLISVSIPEGVTSLGNYAFRYCTGLTNINWNAENISDYGKDVFANAGTDEDGIDVVFGNNVKSIPDCTLFHVQDSNDTPNIKSVTIGNSITNISERSFYNCTNLTSVIIGNSVISIGKYAFFGCSNLISITIPDSVTSIGSSAFYGTAWFDSQLDGDVYAGKVYYKYKGTMPENTNFVLTDGTKGIAAYAFSGCAGLTNLTIPESITSIGEEAFRNCTGLTKIYWNAKHISDYGANVFNNAGTNGDGIEIVFDDSVKDIPAYAFNVSGNSYKPKVNSVTIGNSVTSIGLSAFRGCTGLTNVTIPDSVTSIENAAFSGCTGLTNVAIPDSVKSIGSFAFEGCTGLTNLTIGNTVTYIGIQAFYYCTSLTNITIPKSVTVIGPSAFGNCSNLACVSLPFLGSSMSTDTYLGYIFGSSSYSENATYVPSSLKTIIINSDSHIQRNALYGCSNITDIVFESSNCSIEMNRATIPDNITIHTPCSATAIKNYALTYGKTFEITHPDTVISKEGKEPTCTEDGYTAEQKCSVCGELAVRSTSVPSLGHSAVISKQAKDPTCTEEGYTAEEKCSVCGEVLVSSTIIPSLGGHIIVISKEAKEPTCTEEGCTIEKKCSVCGEVLVISSIIPSLGGHSAVISKEAKEPTCTEDGYTAEQKCSVCGELLAASTYVPSLGHAVVISKEAKEPTCTEDGNTAEQKCSVCGEILVSSTIIPSLGHNAVISKEAKAPTCTEEGNTVEQKCSVCGEMLVGSTTIPSLGHNYELKEIDQYHSLANRYYSVCSVCGYQKYCEQFPVSDYPESQHDYSVYETKGWTYNAPKACTGIEITFDKRTKVCPGDTIVITGLDDSVIGTYTKKELSGKTIAVDGSGFKIELKSVSGSKAFGFKIDSIVGEISDCSHSNTINYKHEAQSTGIGYRDTCEDCGLSFVNNYSEESQNNVFCLFYSTLGKLVVYGTGVIGNDASNAWHNLKDNIISVVIQNGITGISQKAFWEYGNLEDISIADSVVSIGYDAFYGTDYYNNSDNWSSGVLYIDNQLIKADKEISNMEPIRPGTVSIASGAFEDCSNITDVSIPSSVKAIGNKAFYHCANLNDITIPDSVRAIGAQAFEGTAYYDNADNWNSGILYIGKQLIKAVSDGLLSSTTIKAGTIVLADEAFKDCLAISRVSIPSSVKTIGKNCFSGCQGMTRATIGDGVELIDEGAFSKCILKNITIPDSVKIIGDSAFSSNFALEYADIGDGVESIGKNAFSGAGLLSELKIGRSVKTIGENAFYKNMSLTSVVIPDGVTAIEDYAFSEDNALISVKLGQSVERIGIAAFNKCSNLVDVTFGDNLKTIENFAFGDCTSLVSIVVPSSVTKMGHSVFSGCKDLESITLPFVGREIRTDAEPYQYPFGYIFGTQEYSGAKLVSQKYYKDQINILYSESFFVPGTLKSVTITGGSILCGAFYNCSMIEDITLPEISNIGTSAFYNCSSLKQLIIPASVKNINSGAFTGCESLTKIACLNKELDTYEISVNLEQGSTIYAYNYGDNRIIAEEEGKVFIDLAEFDCTSNHHCLSFYDDEIIAEPTCLSEGILRNTCVLCDSDIDTVIPKTDHDLYISKIGIAATCTQPGLTDEYSCSVCGTVVIAQEMIPTESHSPSEWIVDSNSNCTKGGSKHKECIICGTLLMTESIPVMPHNYVSTVVAPSCISDGYTAHSCLSCGDTYIDLIIPAKGHTPGAWIIDQDSTCTASGVKHQLCLVCGETIITEQIPAKGHKYVVTVTAPTCMTDGFTTHTCSTCGNSYADTYVDALGHNEEPIPGKTATCTTTGLTEGKKCSVCGKIITAQKVIPAKGHTPGAWIIDRDSTCTASGVKHQLCLVCKVTIKTEQIPPKGHIPDAWIIDQDSTCTASGAKHQICSVCRVTIKTEQIPAKGHQYENTVTKATCTTNGYTTHKCSACGNTYTDTVVTATGHKDKTTITPATTSADGKIVTTCTVCKKTLKTTPIYKASSINLSAVSFTYNGKVQKPTVTVKNSKGTTLKNGTDYTVSYSSGCKNPGKYAVKVSFKGNYSGSKTLYFTILPGVTSSIATATNSSAIKLTWKAVPGATGYRVFQYDAKTKKYVTVKTLTGTSYTVSKLKSGTTYKFAVRAYSTVNGTVYWASGYKTITATTNPGTPTLSVTAGAKKATLKWTKRAEATGYVVYMATSKTGKYTKIATIKNNSTVSMTKTGLTTGKTYYFKVAAYKTVSGKNIYSSYSSVKYVKIK